MIDARGLIGRADVLFVTLDTLRYDVARDALAAGSTPNLGRALSPGGWEERHTPASFTYAAHHSFFAGFLPTPSRPGPHPRLFAARFEGSETISEQTCVFDAPDIVSGLAARGYHTACVGGVGFFNKQNPLGRVLPDLFDESHWEPRFGVTEPRSTEHQVGKALEIISRVSRGGRVFLFLNVSAIHQPNRIYLPGAEHDSLASHAAALAYVDGELPPLFDALARRGPTIVVICSDHGTAYGEGGYRGHRVAHRVVWTVPYAEFVLPEVCA